MAKTARAQRRIGAANRTSSALMRRTTASPTTETQTTTFASPWAINDPRGYGYTSPGGLRDQATTLLGNPLSWGNQLGRAKTQLEKLPTAWTPAQVTAFINQVGGRYAAPMTDPQMMGVARGMIDPVVKSIGDAITKRAAAQQNAVRGYTEALSNQLRSAGGTFGNPYSQAIASSSAATDALADRLAAGGQATGQDLAQRLAGIDAAAAVDPAVAAATSAPGAGALAATGNANLQELIANQASAASYGQKLPEIANLSGIQQAGLVGQQAISDIAEQTGAVQAQLPQILSTLRAQNETRMSQRAQAQNAAQELAVQQQQTARTNRGNAFITALNNLAQQSDDRRADIASYINSGQSRNQTALTAAAAAGEAQIFQTPGGGIARYDPISGGLTTLQQPTPEAPNYDFITRPDGSIVRANPDGTLTPVAGANAKPGELPTYGPGQFTIDPTTGEVVQLTPFKPTAGSDPNAISSSTMTTARDIINDATRIVAPTQRRDPNNPGQWINVPGTGRQQPESYGDVLAQVIASGPDTDAWRKKARQLVHANPAYRQMGQNGRPYEGKAARQAAQDAVTIGFSRGKTREQILQAVLDQGLIPGWAIRAALKAAREEPSIIPPGYFK